MSGNNEKNEIIPVTVITCGHVDNGKTTGTAVMKYLFGKESVIKHGAADPFVNLAPAGGTLDDFMHKIDRNAEEKTRGVTIDVTTIPLTIPMSNKGLVGLVSLSDCPGHQNYQKNTIMGAKGANAAVIFVTITDGVTAYTKSHITIAAFSQGAGLHLSKERNRELLKNFKVVVVINKIDMVGDPEELSELAELIEMEFFDVADRFGFHEENIRFVRTSARDMLLGIISGEKNHLQRLKDFYVSMREFFQELMLMQHQCSISAKNDGDDKTYMYLENVLNIDGIGEIGVGKVRDGTLKIGDKLCICGSGVKGSESGPYPVVGIEAFHQPRESVGQNSNVGLKLRGVPKDLMKKGFVLSKKPMQLVSAFEADVIFSDGKMIRALSEGVAFKRKVQRYVGFEPNGNDGFNTMPLKVVSFTHNGKTEVFDKNKKSSPMPLGMPFKATFVLVGGSKLPIRLGSSMILREASMNIGQLSVTKIIEGAHPNFKSAAGAMG
jgi:elongation factor Tu